MSRSRRHKRKKPRPTKPPELVARGLWRDGNYLVIDEKSHQFPQRCVKTNEPVDRPKDSIVFSSWGQAYTDWHDLSPDQRDDIMANGRGNLKREASRSHSVALRLPLNRRWYRILTTRIGGWLVAAGLILAFIGRMGLDSRELKPSVFLPLWYYLHLVGLALLPCGLGCIVVVNWMLAIRHISDGKIWIAGVHREYLKALPEFVPNPHILKNEMFRGSSQFWIFAALGISFVVYILFIVLEGHRRDSEYSGLILAFLIAIAVSMGIAMFGSSQMHRARRQLAKHFPSQPRRRRK